MGRRGAGVLVLAVVLVAAAVGPNIAPHRLTGAARAVSVPGPPAVGDCVTEPFAVQAVQDAYNKMDGFTGDGTLASSLASTPDPDVAFPAVVTDPCAGARYGEVAAMVADRRALTSTSGVMPSVPIQNACGEGALSYFGDPAAHADLNPPSPAPRTSSAWSAVLQLSIGATGPSARQLAVGQHWLACVIGVGASGVAESDAMRQSPPYPATMRNAWHTGADRDLIGVCGSSSFNPFSDRPDASSSAVACGQPHVAEIIGYAQGAHVPPTRASVDASCRSYLVGVTGLTDLSAGGRLAVQVLAYDSTIDTAIGDPKGQPAPDALFTCGLLATGSRRLVGGLWHLGSEPIPFAG